MDLGQIGAVPLTLGALVTMGGIIVGVIRGYRWFLDEVKRVVTEALSSHEANESIWRAEVSRRLDAIERKLDQRNEGDPS